MHLKILTLLAGILLAPQDKLRVEELFSKVTAKDPAASLRAIGELAALAREHRPAVEEGLAKLDAFYRDALRAELKFRDEHEALFGKPVLVTLKDKGTAPRVLLVEIEKQAGMRLRLQPEALTQEADHFPLDLVAVPAVEAMVAFCEKAKAQAEFLMGTRDLWIHPLPPLGRPSVYRSFAFFPTTAYRETRVDFGGPVASTLTLYMNPVWDPGAPVDGWKPEIRLVEAVTDKGVALAVADPEPPRSYRRSDELDDGAGEAPMLRIKAPEGAGEKIARIRAVATARIARSAKEYALTPEKSKAADAEFEVTLRVSKSELDGGEPHAIVSVRPLRMGAKDLAERPVRFHPKLKHLDSFSLSVTRHFREDRIEYQIWWYGVDGNPGLEQEGSGLENLQVRIPLEMVERSIPIELTDLPLK
jgi:hypothetical protein